ncbi:MAG: CusA/CzcA family heavy metal efflux RND transporter [Bacteroidales bacterium]|jgi:cobalt-zinc-cadmium resistance protein CzcA
MKYFNRSDCLNRDFCILRPSNVDNFYNMIESLVRFSVRNKLMVFLFTLTIVGFGLFSLSHIPIGAVPDVTNNQVQVITTSRNLSTADVEKFLTYPVEIEMANLPGVQEIRSVSKFGLSVVTIVFDEGMGTYLPRQLIAEKIASASENIPEGFGTPFMGPVSTGLGEIYQYTLDVKPGYEDRYSPMDLRTIQDWIVRRQLSGIPGVVEVNTWGGYLKQYEVALSPQKLRALNIPLEQVWQAVSKNNSVAGGGYIEKNDQSYFVRGEGLVGSLEDIENIVLDNRDGIPVYVKDVGEVHFGYANRFGAITGNGEGEKVLGQVMMLKDANSNDVIERVKTRVAEVSTSLPEGVYINAFLDRSELISRTTFTIAENLILGSLIVIFVVVLLLGNWRSGLVVASIIPLSLLFALSMMYIFGVDANLMSLGAIDFGIIIDGAVIIVEYIAFKIHSNRSGLLKLEKEVRQEELDTISAKAATKMMRSAIFGQIIIIIVFIPILSLTGVEGKMFRPMALTFSFALIGAMILGFTYVPAVSALFIKPTRKTQATWSEKLIAFIYKLYQPTINWALENKRTVILFAGVLVVATILIFSRMGAEFVPVLDEGDFVIQPVLETGTSLSKTIEIMTQIEKIVKTFPEVRQVVSRIGAAEVPTDPMSMEETDVIVTLIPKKQWKTVATKDALADEIKERIHRELPDVELEFTQPIEMRFNELITGVRADLAIKIFGDDLQLLSQKAAEIKMLMEQVPGAADIVMEKTTGLPQMTVRYRRNDVARYGLNVADLNRIVSAAFAGIKAGTVFEGERRFDLVVRYREDARQDLTQLRNTYVPLPNGTQVPLRELADINYTEGPAKISRDNTRRRIVVGVNVRGRDLESVAEDANRIISQNVSLPPGYSVEYGGQFENLRSARNRLMVAVPVALVLIFIMLHFAFGSFREAMLIFTAVPLSIVGGVLLLWIRGMPFSISAGVGFIALFGIAVLNGIVLLEHFKELKAEGMTTLKERVLTGTKQRLRPVLLTASAAALGFLPMAISTNAGAEVQRPLATVVIGGLVSATLLTLVVLPVLYCIMERPRKRRTGRFSWFFVLSLSLIALPAIANAQKEVSLDQALEIALQNNAGYKASALAADQAGKAVATAWDINKTEFYYNYDENNIAHNNEPIKVWGIQQSFSFPTVYGAQRRMLKSMKQMQDYRHLQNRDVLMREVSKAYYEVVYYKELEQQYTLLDTIYLKFAQAAERGFELGESSRLQTLTARSRSDEIKLLFKAAREGRQAALSRLAAWLQTDTTVAVAMDSLPKLEVQTIDTSTHPGLHYFKSSQLAAQNAWSLEKNSWLPDLNFEYFRGSNNAPNAQVYNGFQLGVAIPLFFNAQKNRVNMSRLQMKASQQTYIDYRKHLVSRYQQLLSDLNKYRQAIETYEAHGRPLANEMMNAGLKSFSSGETDFSDYVLAIESARRLMINYLESLYLYNQTVLDINYLNY